VAGDGFVVHFVELAGGRVDDEIGPVALQVRHQIVPAFRRRVFAIGMRGHVLYPKLELGAAYDQAMRPRVFEPLGTRATTFDYGSALKGNHAIKNPDGTISFITMVPGISGFEFVVGAGAKRTLIVRDAQHEYVFTEQGPRALAGAASDPSADPNG